MLRIEPSHELDALARETIGAPIEGHREPGPGYLERVYEEALAIELSLKRLPFLRQPGISVRYKGHKVGKGRLDFLIDQQLVVELRRFPSNDIPSCLSFRPSSVLRQPFHSSTMRLLSRLDDEGSRRGAVPALLGHRSWASCPSRSLLRSSPGAIWYVIFRQSPETWSPNQLQRDSNEARNQACCSLIIHSWRAWRLGG